jgi:hypothetical protein
LRSNEVQNRQHNFHNMLKLLSVPPRTDCERCREFMCKILDFSPPLVNSLDYVMPKIMINNRRISFVSLLSSSFKIV